MKKAIFNEDGTFVDAETGEVIADMAGGAQVVRGGEPRHDEDGQAVGKVTGVPVPKSYSKYEVTPQTEFKVEFCISFVDGRVRLFKKEAKEAHPEFELHWVKFRMWTYKEELDWKRRCGEVDATTRTLRIDQGKYDETKLRNLIRSWSFEEYDPKFKLLHVGGVLSDESYELLQGMFPAIVDNILYMMNSVLEDNQ